MTIEHKLQHFEELCIHSAQEAGEKMTADYTAYLESVLRDHEESKDPDGNRNHTKGSQ